MIKEIREKILNISKYFRLKPFDTSTQAGQANERYRKIALSSVAGGLSQTINYIIMLILVPLLLRYLGEEQYGLWLAINSMAAFAVFSDFGIGNGLINIVGKAHGLEDRELAKKSVSSAFATLSLVALVVLFVGIPLVYKINWASFFRITDSRTAAITNVAVAIYFLFFSANLVLSLTAKIRMAYQEAYINNIFLSITKILMLCGCITGVYTNQNFIYFVIVLAGAQSLAMVGNAILLFGKSRPWLTPSIKNVDRKTSVDLLKTGMFFYITGIAAVLSIQIDTLVIGRFLGAEAIPKYAIPLQLFMIAHSLLGFILIPIWPAYREALVKNDSAWVKKTFFRTIKLTFLVNTGPALILLFFAPQIIMLWTGKQLDISFSLLLALATTTSISCLNGPIAMLLNGANILGIRAIITVIGALINITISIILVQKIGISGPVWATVISQLCITLPAAIYFTKKVLTGKYEKTCK